MTTQNSLLRMIDANADRAAEALRVVGDICRFILDDKHLAASWREMRGKLWHSYSSIPGLQIEALKNRDSIGDTGRSFASSSYQDVVSIARSNIHRAQESFRTLEECMRSVAPDLSSSFSQLRYQCYDLEPATIQRLDIWSMRQKLDFGLYVVLGNEFANGRDFVEVTEKAIAGGVGAIQLRDKEMTSRELLPWAYKLREITAKNNVTFLINDHIELAMAVDADGVHVGQADFPVAEARRILGPQKIIGASTHSVEQAKQSIADGCSYFNIGPIFPTGTKKTAVDPVMPQLIADVVKEIPNFPFTVMGGIKLHHVDELMQQGARRLAVVTAVIAQDDITAAAQAFCDKMSSYL